MSSVRRCKLLLCMLLPLSLNACDTNSLKDPSHVRVWANAASAVGVFSRGYEPLAFSDNQLKFTDSACPKTLDNGTMVTINGECTNTQGKTWKGTATITRTANGDRTVTLKDYGSGNDATSIVKATGQVTVHKMDNDLHKLQFDLVEEGGVTTTIHYTTTVRGGYNGKTVWDGAGIVDRRGLAEPAGVVQASTSKQTLDNSVCSGQALSGTTTIVASGQTAVITYDGSTACDAEKSARWSVDGVDQGLITGIGCDLSGPASRMDTFPLALLFCIALLRKASRPAHKSLYGGP